jgi:hypothetical protein
MVRLLIRFTSNAAPDRRSWLQRRVEAELAIPQPNLTGLKAGTNQHRPEIAFPVIHFAIVYFDFRTEASQNAVGVQFKLYYYPECR